MDNFSSGKPFLDKTSNVLGNFVKGGPILGAVLDLFLVRHNSLRLTGILIAPGGAILAGLMTGPYAHAAGIDTDVRHECPGHARACLAIPISGVSGCAASKILVRRSGLELAKMTLPKFKIGGLKQLTFRTWGAEGHRKRLAPSGRWAGPRYLMQPKRLHLPHKGHPTRKTRTKCAQNYWQSGNFFLPRAFQTASFSEYLQGVQKNVKG